MSVEKYAFFNKKFQNQNNKELNYFLNKIKIFLLHPVKNCLYKNI